MAISDLELLLASMQPTLNPGTYAYVSVTDPTLLAGIDCVATMHEAEGLTAIVAAGTAEARGLPILFRAAWITLSVHSDLQAVGLTAAFATALGDVGISCNVVAGAYHDHIFVPVESATAALLALQELQRGAALGV